MDKEKVTEKIRKASDLLHEVLAEVPANSPVFDDVYEAAVTAERLVYKATTNGLEPKGGGTNA